MTELTRSQWERLTRDMTRAEMLDTVAGIVTEANEAAWEQGYSAGRLDEFRDVHDILHVRASNPYRAHSMPAAVRQGGTARRTDAGGSSGPQETGGPSDGRTERLCGTPLDNGERCFLPAGHADGCLPKR